MTTTNSIPADILYDILEALSNSDLNECNVVCKSWSSVSLLVYVKQVSFQDDNIKSKMERELLAAGGIRATSKYKDNIPQSKVN